MNSEEQNQEQGQNEGGKVKKKFESAMSHLNSILQGNKDIYGSKIQNDEVGGIVEELLKERSQKAKEEFKKEASAVIDEVIAYEDFMKKKVKEFEDAQAQKMKELTSKINSVTGKIKNIGDLHKKYVATLNVKVEPDEEVGPEQHNN